MKKKWTNCIKFASFLSIVFVVLICLDNFLFIKIEANSAYKSFYKEKENTIDFVAVGNSTIYDGIIPLQIWNEYHVTSCNVCSAPIHPEVIIIAIDEIARTQSPKVVYIDINGLTYQTEDEKESFVKEYINSMPDCEEKSQLLEKYPYAKVTPTNNTKKFELFKYHNSFRNTDYLDTLAGKMLYARGGYVVQTKVKKQKAVIADSSIVKPLPQDGMNYLQKILDTCDKYPDIHFVFGKMPKFLNSKTVEETYILRSAIPVIEERGYKYFDWSDYISEIGLDEMRDSHDEHHLNIYGAQKFTSFLIKFLDEKYNFVSGLTYDSDVEKSFDDDYKVFYDRVLRKL